MRTRALKLYAVMLWCYSFFLCLVWFIAALTPEKAVLLRIFSSAVSDIVWLPIGVAVLGHTLNIIFRRIGCGSVFSVICGLVAALPLIVWFHDVAFRFILVPIVVAVISLVISLIRDRTRACFMHRFLPAVSVLLLFLIYYQSQLLPNFSAHDKGRSFTVMTYNILGYAQEERRRHVFSTILDVEPDILFCTEFNPRTDPENFERELGHIYPYHVSNRDETCWRTGEVIYSKFPLEARPSPTLLTDNHLIADVKISGRNVCLANLHLTRVGRHTAIDTLDTWMEKAVMMTKYESINDRKKNKQGSMIFKKLSDGEYPVIICGDFNDTPNGKVCRRFNSAYKNAFSEAGWGLGATYGEAAIRYEMPGILLLRLLAKDIIRIDHAYVSDDIHIHYAHVVSNAEGSDHKPLVVELALPK